MLGDGTQLYLTDFGLLLGAGFELDEAERAFLARHSHYDYGEAIASIGSLLLRMVENLDTDRRARLRERYGIGPAATPHEALRVLVDRIEEVHLDGDLPIEPAFVEAVRRYRDVIVFMSRFLGEQHRNHAKDTPYDDAELATLLDAAGIRCP